MTPEQEADLDAMWERVTKKEQMTWISVKDRLPEEGKIVKFLHHGYEFHGSCFHSPFPYQDILSNRQYPNWFFKGTQNGGTVTTIDVTHWMPIPEAPKTDTADQ